MVAATDGAVNMLKRSAQMLQQDNDDFAFMNVKAGQDPSSERFSVREAVRV